jgi:hypothetical protein
MLTLSLRAKANGVRRTEQESRVEARSLNLIPIESELLTGLGAGGLSLECFLAFSLGHHDGCSFRAQSDKF